MKANPASVAICWASNRCCFPLTIRTPQARDFGLLNARTVVVLPEHIGTWLFASGEKDQLYQAPTIEDAMDWLSWSNPLQFIAAMLGAEGRNRQDDAHLRLKARAMARDYQALFGGLAREFNVTLVAGSIVLPDPSVESGQLKVGDGALYNSSVTFGSDWQTAWPASAPTVPRSSSKTLRARRA